MAVLEATLLLRGGEGPRDLECRECGGIGFVWEWRPKAEAAGFRVLRCGPCEGRQVHTLALPHVRSWLAVDKGLTRAEADRAIITCAWERGWPRRLMWRVQMWRRGARWEGKHDRSPDRALVRMKEAMTHGRATALAS